MAAHPDDEVLGVGGTLLRHVEAGDEVRVVLAYECRPEGQEESFETEQRLGVTYVRRPDIDAVILEWLPDVVYTHSLADLHHEHRELHERVLVACRPPGVKAIYAFETPSATDWGMTPFLPTRFVDITSTIAQKVYALGAYTSELRPDPHPRNPSGITKYAQFRGLTAGLDYAEAFEVIRETW